MRLCARGSAESSPLAELFAGELEIFLGQNTAIWNNKDQIRLLNADLIIVGLKQIVKLQWHIKVQHTSRAVVTSNNWLFMRHLFMTQRNLNIKEKV